ncbi:MAG: carbon-nitrogen hydrolase family protein [Myxococcales bacterium]
MAETLRVGVVQLNSGDDVGANLDACRRLIAKAADLGAQFVALPENFAFFGSEQAKRELAERSDEASNGPILEMLSTAASAHRVYVLGGGWPESSADALRPYNTAIVVGPDGRIIARYRKIHLFDVDAPDGHAYRESNGVTPGASIECVTIEGFRVGLSICYDLRFPELYRRLVDEGAEIVCIPSAFTFATGQAHWHLLCRARAIENQCFVIAPGQWGSHPRNRKTFGHSLILDPWGEILEEISEGEGVAVATLNRERLVAVRNKLPSLSHRRL